MRNIEYAGADSLFNRRLLPEGVIHWSEAKDHLGEQVSVYGEVASTYFDWAEYERFVGITELGILPPPTFIEIGAKYPNKELLKAVIWGSDWSKFNRPPDIQFKDSAVVLTGKPYMYNELVCIKISDPEDIVAVAPIEGLYISPGISAAVDSDFQPVFSKPFVDEGRRDRGYERSSSRDDYDDFWDNPAYMDPSELRPGLYNEGRGDCFYVDDYGRKCDVQDSTEFGGTVMYFDEDNGTWLEVW